MSTVDLHLHTTASDGKLTPEQLVLRAAWLGMRVIAVTDHDTVDGVTPALLAATACPGLRVIPGVELSTDSSGGEVHVLGYFVDHTDTVFLEKLKDMRESRSERARGMVRKLNQLGMRVDFERVKEIAAGGALGRPHVAQALLEKGYVASFQDAFRRYIGSGGPAYVERQKLTPAEAVALVLETNGLPVLAHPLTAGAVEDTIRELKSAGLIGLEVYYAGYSDEETASLLGLAERYELIATGGTDYHGIDPTSETMIGGAAVPETAAARLIELAELREKGRPRPAGKENP